MTQGNAIKKLNTKQIEIMKYLSRMIGLENFILYGGAALDLLVNPSRKVSDFDIAHLEYNLQKLERCREDLIKNGCEITNRLKHYTVNRTTPVLLLYARTDEEEFDIAFLDHESEIGQFSIDSLIWRYPEAIIEDRFGALEAFRNKTLQPVRGLGKENPLLLLRCLIKAVGKYDIDLSSPSNKEVAVELRKRLESINPQEVNDDLEGEVRSAFLTTLLKNQNPRRFLKSLHQVGLLKHISRVFSEIIEIDYKKGLDNTIRTSANIVQLLKNLLELLPAKQARELSIEFKVLEGKEWDFSNPN